MKRHARSLWVAGLIATVSVFGWAIVAGAFPPAKPYDPRPLMPDVEKKITTDKYTFVVMGDVKGGGGYVPLVKRVDILNPALVVLTGDMVSAGTPQLYNLLEKQMGESARKIPYWPCLGNHEMGGQGFAPYAKFWGINTRHYSFDFKNARFICVDAPGRQPGGAELGWIEKQLAEGQKAGKLLFIWQHVPCYTVGSKTKGEVPGRPTAFTKLCTKYGVIADFAGHDHIYHRTLRDGVSYIIQGLAGAGIYGGSRRREAIEGDAYVVASGRGMLVHNASGEKTVKLAYLLTLIEVDGKKVTGKTMTGAGEVVDEFTLAPAPAKKAAASAKPVEPEPVPAGAEGKD
jgi:hypothetical protein